MNQMMVILNHIGGTVTKWCHSLVEIIKSHHIHTPHNNSKVYIYIYIKYQYQYQ